MAAVGREGVGLREAELLFVDPVGRAVDDLVPAAVVGDAARAAACEVVDVEVVLGRVGNRLPVGREGGVARPRGVAQHGADAAVGGEQVARRVGVAVDGRLSRSDEDAALVGREFVVGDGEPLGRGGEQRLSRRRLGIGVAHDVVALDDGVVLAVGRRAEAVHPLVHRLEPGDGLVVLCPGAGRKQQQGAQQEELSLQDGCGGVRSMFLVSGSAEASQALRHQMSSTLKS